MTDLVCIKCGKAQRLYLQLNALPLFHCWGCDVIFTADDVVAHIEAWQRVLDFVIEV